MVSTNTRRITHVWDDLKNIHDIKFGRKGMALSSSVMDLFNTVESLISSEYCYMDIYATF
jgi:hypothetical protein